MSFQHDETVETRSYEFRVPFAAGIRPLITNPDVTFSLLQEINASMSPSKQLPTELLVQIHQELHLQNPALEDVWADWSPLGNLRWNDIGGYLAEFERTVALTTTFNPEKKEYYVSREIPQSDPNIDISLVLSHHISAADLLYRLRCFFPEVNISSILVDGYRLPWAAFIQHNKTDMFLIFRDWKGGAEVIRGYKTNGVYDTSEDIREILYETFLVDATKLLNYLFGAINSAKPSQSAYYHPAAIVDLLEAGNERFVAVPKEVTRQPLDPDLYVYARVFKKFRFNEISGTNVSSFRSILHDLKYDINTRKIDRVNGTSNLTTVISSALLFYRLVCIYTRKNKHKHYNPNQLPPMTSVWQVQLTHYKTAKNNMSLIFMDDRGLFDIRVNGDTAEIMDDIEYMVEGLCSDNCMHPYGRTLLGCVATV